MPVIAQLSAVITADTSGFERSMRSVSLGLSLAGAEMAALGASFGALIKVGSDVQQALVHVAGNTSMIAAEFDNLQQSVVRLGTTMPVALDDIGKAYMQAANFGFHFAEANIVVEAALKSAVATGANAEATVRSLAIAMHQFNIPAEEAAKTMDVLHLAAARGGQTLEQFTAVTGRVFGVAHAMGISLIDAAAALSALTSSGLTAAQAATLLQGAIVKIANPAKQAAAEVARLSKATGIDLVGDFSKAGLSAKGLSGVMDDISRAVGGDTAEILKLVPALRGGIGVILLTSTAAKDYKDRLQELADVMAGKLKPTQQDFERVMATVGAQAKITANAFEALGFEVVRVFGPTLVTALQTLNGILPQVVLFIGQLPPAIFAAAAAFSSMLVVIGTVMVSVGGLVLLLGGPLTLAIVGVATAVGAMAAAVALNFNRIVLIFTQGSGTIKLNFIDLAGKAGALADAFQVMARVAIAAFDIILTGAILMAQGVKSSFDVLKGLGQVLAGIATQSVPEFTEGLIRLGNATLNTAQTMSDSLKGLGQRLKGDLADIGSHASGEFAKSFAKAAMDAGISFRAASAQQHAAMEEAGLKLVNAYLTGAVKGKAISAAVWHGMTDEARQAFIHTAELWVQSNTMLDGVANNIAKNGKKISQSFAEIPESAGLAANAVNFFGQLAVTAIEQVVASLNEINVPVSKAANAFGQLTSIGKDLKALGDELNKTPAAIAALNEATVQAIAFGSDWLQFINRAKQAELDHQNSLKETARTFTELSHQIPDAWNVILDGIMHGLGATGDAFNALGVKVKGFAKDVLGVIDELPGRWGDALRKTTSEINRWVNTIDSAIKIIQRILGEIPTGLSGVLQKVIGIFKGATSTITEGTKDLAAALGESVESVIASVGSKAGVGGAKTGLSFASGFLGKLALVGSGIATFFSTQNANGVVNAKSIAGAALAGAQIGAAFGGPFGAAIGAAIGAAVGGWHSKNPFVRFFTGGLISLIFGGPSDAQKKAEEEAKKKAEIATQQTINTVVDTAINTMKDALELFEKLADFTVIPQKTIHRFFNHLDLLLQEFLQLSKKFGDGMLDAAKALAEKMGPIVEVIGNAVDAFEKLGGFTGVAQVSIDAFASAMTRVLQSFIAIKDKFLDAEGFINTTVNQVKKFANKIGDVIIMIKDALDAFAGFAAFRNVLPETLDAFNATLKLAIEKMGEIAESLDKAMVKDAQRFSDRAASIVSLIGAAVAAFTPLAKFAGVPAAAFDALFEGITISVVRMQDLAALINVEMLNLVSSIANKVGPIVSIIGTAVEAFKGLIELKAVPLASIGLLVDGIKQAIDLMIPLAASIDVDMADKASVIADKTGNVVELIGKAVDGFSKLAEFKGVPALAMAALFEGIRDASARMLALASTLDTDLIDDASIIADKINVIVNMIGSALTAFTPLANFKGLAADALTALFDGIKDAVAKMQEMAATMDAGMLDAAIVIATKVDTIFGVIGRAASVLENLANFHGVAPGTFQLLLDGFNMALAILNEMLNKATLFESIAIAIEDKLVSAAKHLQAGTTAVAAALASATTATGGISGGGATGIASLSAGPSVTGFGIGAPAAPFAAGSGSTVVETYHVSVTVQGSMLGTKSELQDVVVGAITQAQRRGRAAA